MTYEEFVKKCESLNDVDNDYCYFGKPEKFSSEDCVYVEWHIGGSSGANCWDNSPSLPYTASYIKTSKLSILDKIIDFFVPKISLSEYREIMDKVFEGSRSDDGDWYGNYSTYAYKAISLEFLYNFFSQKGYLNNL